MKYTNKFQKRASASPLACANLTVKITKNEWIPTKNEWIPTCTNLLNHVKTTKQKYIAYRHIYHKGVSCKTTQKKDISHRHIYHKSALLPVKPCQNHTKKDISYRHIYHKSALLPTCQTMSKPLKSYISYRHTHHKSASCYLSDHVKPKPKKWEQTSLSKQKPRI